IEHRRERTASTAPSARIPSASPAPDLTPLMATTFGLTAPRDGPNGGLAAAAQPADGRRGASGNGQGRAASNARAARRTSASACIGPTICNPTGRPAAVNPQGTDAAGCWVRLNGLENGAQLIQRGWRAGSGRSRPASNATSGRVG